MPHFDSPDRIQHVTFHLADSLPATVLARMEESLRAAPAAWRDAERRRRIEDWIDAGHGCCLLREPEAARLVQDSLLHFDAERYRLLAWVVMPNHVHALFQCIEGWTVSKIVSSWKSFTGRRLAASFPPIRLEGERVWHREYWDRFVRDAGHFLDAKRYIHENPVMAGLVTHAVEWEWSSAWVHPGMGKP